jgi:hypothetical protein
MNLREQIDTHKTTQELQKWKDLAESSLSEVQTLKAQLEVHEYNLQAE